MSRTPVEVVEEWHERAWGEGDLSAVDDLVADHYVRHGPSGTVTRSRDQMKQDLLQYQRTLHRPIITVHDRVVDGDRVWSRISMRGANLDTGECRTVSWLQIHRVVDGRLAEVWTLYANDVDWE